MSAVAIHVYLHAISIVSGGRMYEVSKCTLIQWYVYMCMLYEEVVCVHVCVCVFSLM